MLRRPRRTLHSDGRIALDDLSDRIYNRLTSEEERHGFLFAIASMSVDDADSSDARRQAFADVAKEYMTPQELSLLGVRVDARNDLACEDCGCIIMMQDMGAVVCSQCGASKQVVSFQARDLPFKDSVAPVHVYPYRRANHFQEWLTQFQGKETTCISSEVIDAVRDEMRKLRLEAASLTETNMRQILKSLRLNKFYEHVPYLLYAIAGRKPTTLAPAVEEEMKSLFQQIQEPFDKAIAKVAPQRRNFLSYSYVLRKFSELLELDDISHRFSLLKSRDKLHVQDRIWREICAQLNWRFIPSL